jgi:hypothetical protein
LCGFYRDLVHWHATNEVKKHIGDKVIKGAQQLPVQHITIRVPWHDSGWNGTICSNPCSNTSCLTLPRIGVSRRDDLEQAAAGKSIHEMSQQDLPPCVGEHGTFMARFPVHQIKQHPYRKAASGTHGHFADTPYTLEPLSAAAIPFRWMLKASVEGGGRPRKPGLAELLALGYDPSREPQMPGHIPDIWLQEGRNQRILLDTFFSAVRPKESLVFFYAKRTPLSDDTRRVIVGVGRVTGVGQPTEYLYSKERSREAISGYLWERTVAHSIRVDGNALDGFLMPYLSLQGLAEQDAAIDLSESIAFAPEEAFEQFSYGSELLTQDNAIASLLSMEKALRAIKSLLPGPWDEYRTWIDSELNRLWKLRGPFAGFGAALTAFGIPNGNLLAWHIASVLQGNAKHDPWGVLVDVLRDPLALPQHLRTSVGPTTLKKWIGLLPERRQLLMLLSRFEVSDEQALFWFTRESRRKAGIVLSDTEILANPYLLYEAGGLFSIPFGTLDRGLMQSQEMTAIAPVPEPSRVNEVIDPRRVRALMVDRLEAAAEKAGHTVLPEPWLIESVRSLALAPECPLDPDVMPIFDGDLKPAVHLIIGAEGARYYQLNRYAETRQRIADFVRKRRRGANLGDHDWRALVDAAIEDSTPPEQWDDDEVPAREEKADALAMIFRSRISVLLGAAGTGKSTLIKALCKVPGVLQDGVLLLAPTGKARVRLEQTSGMRGRGKTIAQFLNRLERYDGRTGRYFMNPTAATSAGDKTVVIDECSMLTEEQLAATLDALSNVDRLVLLGDPKQLSPIGAGRPFVDIVNQLRSEGVEAMRPRVSTSYAELLVTRRQKKGQDRSDLDLANLFTGGEPDPGRDEIWSKIRGAQSKSLRVVSWASADDLERELIGVLTEELDLKSVDDEAGFEKSYGGSEYDGHVYFWPKRGVDSTGAAEKAEDWQILSPLRTTQVGTDAVNRLLQSRFRFTALRGTTQSSRRIPKPLGPHRLLWGDKVINVQNSDRRKCWPEVPNAYVANGEIGVATGFYKTQGRPSVFEQLEVELASQPGTAFTYKPWEFSAESSPPLELAYALTVHKTQGSEFVKTFLVIPNPCRILTRELLYTALTRQQERLVLLVQGDLTALQEYVTDGASEIKRRMTNLFDLSTPVEVTVGRRKIFFDDRLIYRTDRGELVQSKSEWIIADKLNAAGLRYLYEKPIVLDSTERLPDFTISDDDQGITWYWEHLGRMDLSSYRARWAKKLAGYVNAGIVPYDQFKPGESKGVLVTTIEDGTRGDLSEQIAVTLKLIIGE